MWIGIGASGGVDGARCRAARRMSIILHLRGPKAMP
jgi:hypothetical protein